MNKAILLAALLATTPLAARDNGNWSTNPQSWREWFPRVHQPDTLVFNTPTSCCGEADAYETDLFEVAPNGDIIAIITDGTGGENKVTVPDGTRIRIPASAIVLDQHEVASNPTGHGWVFLGNFLDDGTTGNYQDSPSYRHVYCYVAPTLV
jgi:hypothetical protein